MDTWRVEPPRDGCVGLPAGIARFGAAGLLLRLTSLRQRLERDYPLTLALDITDRDAAEGLPAGLTAAVHTLLQEAALNAARHSGASLVRLAIHVGGNSVLLRIEDDGAGFAFKGVYELGDLLTFAVGPQTLAQLVAVFGGRMRLDSRAGGSRIEITLERDAAAPREAAAVPRVALAIASYASLRAG